MNERIPRLKFGWIIWIVLAVVLFVNMRGCWQQIPPASVGIKFSATNGISETLLKPHLTVVYPFQQLIIYPTSMKNASYVKSTTDGSSNRDESIVASTMEGAALPVDVTVAWHVDAGNVVTAFKNFGTDNLTEIQENFIRYIAIYGVNAVSGQQSIFSLTAKDRESFGPKVKEVIKPILEEYGVTVDEVYIGEVYPAQEIMDTVADRVTKRNELELAKVNLERARIDAKTLVTNAERDMEVNALKAQQGETAVELRRLEIYKKALSKWNGVPPEIGSPKVPFTDIKVNPSE